MALRDIIGQEAAVRAIKNIILKEKLGGGYLFLGRDGVGKRMAAINFAKAINCKSKNGDACDECISCKKIEALNHPDVFLIQKEMQASSIKIDTIREIIYQSSLKPYEAKCKVYIIIDAWSLTEEAANSLLKILEESPGGQVFILTTTDISRMFPTIVSRCQIIRFGRLNIEAIRDLLVKKFCLEKNLANLLAHISGQNLSKAIELKDRDFWGLREVALGRLKEGFEGFKDKETIEELLLILLDWYRDIFILKFGDEQSSLINIDRYQKLSFDSRRFSIKDIEDNIELVLTTLGYIRNNINPKLALEVLSSKLKEHAGYGTK